MEKENQGKKRGPNEGTFITPRWVGKLMAGVVAAYPSSRNIFTSALSELSPELRQKIILSFFIHLATIAPFFKPEIAQDLLHYFPKEVFKVEDKEEALRIALSPGGLVVEITRPGENPTFLATTTENKALRKLFYVLRQTTETKPQFR